jgi:hypothetical protein
MEVQQGGALGHGGREDVQDQDVVYVYDSLKFHFYRAEQYHQFHPNTVIHREVPEQYTVQYRNMQEKLGRFPTTGCPENVVSLGGF